MNTQNLKNREKNNETGSTRIRDNEIDEVDVDTRNQE